MQWQASRDSKACDKHITGPRGPLSYKPAPFFLTAKLKQGGGGGAVITKSRVVLFNL